MSRSRQAAQPLPDQAEGFVWSFWRGMMLANIVSIAAIDVFLWHYLRMAWW